MGRPEVMVQPLQRPHPLAGVPVGLSGRADLIQPPYMGMPVRDRGLRGGLVVEPGVYININRPRHIDPLHHNHTICSIAVDDHPNCRRRSHDDGWAPFFSPLRRRGSCDSLCRGALPCKVDTKDVTIRGKTYSVRKAFLEDCGKFEKDIQSYADKKNDTMVPDYVIQMLIDCVNEKPIAARKVLDLVTLNIAANNVGVKSVVKKSQKMLDDSAPVEGEAFVDIVATVLLSSKVPDGLTSWLEKELRAGGYYDLIYSSSYPGLIADHPEVCVSVETMVGLRAAPDDTGLRVC